MSHKVLIVGKRKTGKTSLRTLMTFDYFVDSYNASESVSMSSRTTPEGNFLFIDAYEMNPILVEHRYTCIFLMFDQSNQESLADLESFYQHLKHHTNLFFLVGNKKDLTTGVTEETLQALAHHLQCRYFLISCKTGEGLDSLWQSLLSKLNNSVKFKVADHERFIEKLEKFKKQRQEFRTPQKQNTYNLIKTRSKKKVIHRKVKSLNNNKSLLLPAITPMSAEQFRRFLNNFKNK